VLRCEGDEDEDENLDHTPIRVPLVPDIFSNVASEVLTTGKVVGLLREIGIEPFTAGESQISWCTFSDIYDKTLLSTSDASSSPLNDDVKDSIEEDVTYSPRMAIGSLNTTLLEHVSPWCKSANLELNKLLMEDCDMMGHLSAIENFYFMRQGDAMAAFCDRLFAKVSAYSSTLGIVLTRL